MKARQSREIILIILAMINRKRKVKQRGSLIIIILESIKRKTIANEQKYKTMIGQIQCLV